VRHSAAHLLSSLNRNVVAGFRLGLFMRVSRDDFAVGPGHFALLAAFNTLVWIAGSAMRQDFQGSFNAGALPVMLAGITVLLLACLIASRLLRDETALVALAVLLLSTDLLFEVAGSFVYFAFEGGWLPDWQYLHFGVYVAYVAWAAASAVRAQVVVVPWGSRGSRRAAVLLVLLVLAFAYVPRDEPWQQDAADDEDAPSEILQEDAVHAQGMLLSRDLAAIAPQRQGVEDMYFMGVAPYARQDTFATELGMVRELMDRRFDTAGRSLVLVNHPATVTRVPIATAANLRTALAQFGEIMNVEEDVLFLYITTHGSKEHELSFEWPPLNLRQVNPALLARMLADSGIKWRVIVLSACYSGGFIESLRDANTAVITASDADHPSFGCETESQATWFGRAFMDEALREEAAGGTYSLEAAFERARKTVAERERAAGYDPSNPQMAIGDGLREKLRGLASRLSALPRERSAPATLPQVQAALPAGSPGGVPVSFN
jgi:hypothetical protein